MCCSVLVLSAEQPLRLRLPPLTFFGPENKSFKTKVIFPPLQVTAVLLARALSYVE